MDVEPLHPIGRPVPLPEESGAEPAPETGLLRLPLPVADELEVRSEEEFDKVRAGDVLVCPITSPTWSVLCPSIGALVTDAGGLLSHPAIIARESGIPAVLATGRATEELEDGQIVSVDGAAGRVDPYSEAPPLELGTEGLLDVRLGRRKK